VNAKLIQRQNRNPRFAPSLLDKNKENPSMPAYLIATITVHDQGEYDQYLAGFGPTFAPYFARYRGRVLVATDDVEVMEGKWPNLRTIVIEFATMEDAKRWYKSPEYQTLAQHRFKAATSNLVFANGYEGA
jgi:uncharacterized protein (DUF1330 family)